MKWIEFKAVDLRFIEQFPVLVTLLVAYFIQNPCESDSRQRLKFNTIHSIRYGLYCIDLSWYLPASRTEKGE